MAKKKHLAAITFEQVATKANVDLSKVDRYGFTRDTHELTRSELGRIHHAAGGVDNWPNVVANEVLRTGRTASTAEATL